MPSFANLSTVQLRKRLQEAEEELEKREHELVLEIQLLRALIQAKEVSEERTYALTVSPLEAIELCLDLNGHFKLTKPEIMKEILTGGYLAAKPKAARGLLNDSLNFHIKKGRLALQGELVGRNPHLKAALGNQG